MRMQQQQQQLTSDAAAMAPVVTHLNMQQRVEAAAALQDLRGNITFQQPQLQQPMKYGVQQQQQPLPQMQQQVMKLDTSSLGDPNCQPPQSPLPVPPPPYIRTPPLHSEADVHNGSPTSSSSGPYPNLPNMSGPPRTSQQCNAPIQLPELESDSSYSSLMHPSQSNILPHSKAKNVQNGLLQTQQSLQSSPSGMSAQQLRGHSPQSRMAQQADRSSTMHPTGHGLEGEMPRQPADLAVLNPGLQAPGSLDVSTSNQGSLQNGNLHNQNGHGSPGLPQNGMLNSVAFHHGGRSLPACGLQNGTRNGNIQQPGGQVFSSRGDPARAGATILHQKGGLSMPSSAHLQQGVQSVQNAMSNVGHNGMMHQQGGLRMQDGIVIPAGHMSSVGPQKRGHSGAIIHQPVQGFSSSMQQQQQTGFPPLLRDMQVMQQVPNSWYPSIRDTTTISETQPSVSTSRLQHSKVEPVAYSVNSPMYSCVTELGSQRGISTAMSQINQVQNGYRDVLPDQDLRQQVCGSSSNMMGKVLPVQTDPQGRKFLQGNNFSATSSSGGDMSSNSTMINGAFDDPTLLQRAFTGPQPKITRSYIKVYKLGSITRAVDVNRFKDYTELRCELARMFNLDGQLDPKVGWQLVFTDNEDDLLLVGDDPWEEFVRNVRGIRILTPAEVYYYTNEDKCTAAAYNPAGGSAPKPM
nr:auxin response factor 7-like isoform X2 [Physcomitrium patens]|eukprot:XP_024384534.1 auxin response factor 7-like isoform X2 [Physcomitrella patens]